MGVLHDGVVGVDEDGGSAEVGGDFEADGIGGEGADVIVGESGDGGPMLVGYESHGNFGGGGGRDDGFSARAGVSAEHAVPAEVRLYDRLFLKEDPSEAPEGEDWKANINTESLKVLNNCRLEPNLAGKPVGFICQFERIGYFCADKDSSSEKPVFNRTVSLKDEWARIQGREELRVKS